MECLGNYVIPTLYDISIVWQLASVLFPLRNYVDGTTLTDRRCTCGNSVLFGWKLEPDPQWQASASTSGGNIIYNIIKCKHDNT